ncbi:MAG: DUF2934 domain-containing protein [Acidobacteriota bacterium]|nr:DUF2934 domain-containing protein [Acidobacteriota bacterium]
MRYNKISSPAIRDGPVVRNSKEKHCMAITRTAPSKHGEPKAQRSPRRATAPPPAATATPSFDAVAHQKEIAQVAYRIWLERADRPGSPEADWLKAEAEVRAKYARQST